MTTTELRRIAQSLSLATTRAHAEAERAHHALMASMGDEGSISHLIIASGVAERALDAAIEAEEHAWQAVSYAEQADHEASFTDW